MAARLTDKQKKKIVVDYLNNQSYRATAKMNGVNPSTVKRVVEGSGDFAQKAAQKKQDDEADVLEYMEKQRGLVCDIIGLGLAALNNPEKLADAPPSQITTMIGTLVDKWTQARALRGQEPTAEDDALTQSIKALGDEMEAERVKANGKAGDTSAE